MIEKNVDQLLQALHAKRKEFQALGDKIRKSAHEVVVCFVDLTDSTAIKTSLAAEEWLGYINEFLATSACHAQEAGGSVIKRIGDELMVSFPNTDSSEMFLAAMLASPNIRAESFKAALDLGEAYYLRFSKELPDDPYGEVIDRCARIAKIAGPGAILCSATYHRKARGKDYRSAGTFSLKGLREPIEIFLRQPPTADEEYYEPILRALRQKSLQSEGFSTIPRQYDADYLASLGDGKARPFVARALLNVPRLAESPQILFQRFHGPQADEEKERVRGYFIDWIVTFKKSKVRKNDIQLFASIPEASPYDDIWVEVMPSMLEVVRGFTAGQLIRLRGIITEVYIGSIMVNYADFETVEAGKPVTETKVVAPPQQNQVEAKPAGKSWWRFWE
jgi:class 3 adenylate cyclase